MSAIHGVYSVLDGYIIGEALVFVCSERAKGLAESARFLNILSSCLWLHLVVPRLVTDLAARSPSEGKGVTSPQGEALYPLAA